MRDLSDDTVVIDTSNYYPARDSDDRGHRGGQVESLWVAERLGRPIVKAWNAIGSDSFATRASQPGPPIASPSPWPPTTTGSQGGDGSSSRTTGFDAVRRGTLAESWRQQPGTPGYCTDLTREEMPGALAAADAARRRSGETSRWPRSWNGSEDVHDEPDAEFGVRLSRALFM